MLNPPRCLWLGAEELGLLSTVGALWGGGRSAGGARDHMGRMQVCAGAHKEKRGGTGLLCSWGEEIPSFQGLMVLGVLAVVITVSDRCDNTVRRVFRGQRQAGWEGWARTSLGGLQRPWGVVVVLDSLAATSLASLVWRCGSLAASAGETQQKNSAFFLVFLIYIFFSFWPQSHRF